MTEQPRPAPDGGKRQAVQVLRFIAAALVVLAHASGPRVPDGAPTGPLRPDFLGAVGVSAFFIVSGFIMVHATRGEFGRRGAIRSFLRKRVVRIVPTYWLATGAMLAVYLLGSGRLAACNVADPAYLAASFLFVAHARCDGVMQPLLSQGWTLNYEAFFYVAFALSMALPRNVGMVALGFGFVALVTSGDLLARLGTPTGSLWGFYSDPVVLLFVGGMAVARLRERPGLQFQPPGGVVVLAAVVLAALLVIDVVVPYSSEPGRSRVLVWVVAPLIALPFVFAGPPAAPQRFALVLETLGDASYSIYLTHIFSLMVVNKLWARLGLEGHALGFVVCGTLAALAAGTLFYWIVERPLVILLRSGTSSPRVPVEFRVPAEGDRGGSAAPDGPDRAVRSADGRR